MLLRQRVANFYYVLYFTRQAPSRFLHLLSAFITWVTAVVIPPVLLLWIQVRFLPFHSVTDTWLHRAAVVIDVALILSVLLPRVTPLLRSKAKMPGWQASLRQAWRQRESARPSWEPARSQMTPERAAADSGSAASARR